MKNIHLIPTDNPSRFHKIGNELGYTNTPNSNFLAKQQNIYITSDEEVKEGEWFITKTNDVLKVQKPERGYEPMGKKIILTTDIDLIGVQAIDDKFLQWFVKNPSCEEAMIALVPINEFGSEITVNGYGFNKFIYKITYALSEPLQEESKSHSFCETPEENCTMNYCDENGCQNRKRDLVEPKQEQEVCNHCGKTLREQMKGCGEISCYRQFLPIKKVTIDELLKEYGENLTESEFKILNNKINIKQETLEEAAERMYKQSYDEFGEPTWDEGKLFHRKAGFIEGAKWQQEQDQNKYSEEQMREAIVKSALSNTDNMIERCDEIIAEFKKK